jgi:hypothetical protein
LHSFGRFRVSIPTNGKNVSELRVSFPLLQVDKSPDILAFHGSEGPPLQEFQPMVSFAKCRSLVPSSPWLSVSQRQAGARSIWLDEWPVEDHYAKSPWVFLELIVAEVQIETPKGNLPIQLPTQHPLDHSRLHAPMRSLWDAG